MTNELVLNASGYGIEELKAKELLGNLPNIIEERKPLEDQFSDVIKMDIELPETWVTAKNLRLLIQKNRTQGILVWHKTSKDFFLKGGQFVDAIKRKETVVNERMESDLKQIEQHEQIIETERLEKLRDKRNSILEKYDVNPGVGDTTLMSEEVWSHYISSVESTFQAKIAAEKKAEVERIAKEKEAIKDQKRIKAENDRLKIVIELKRISDEKEEKERLRLEKIEQDKRNKQEQERQLKAELERKERLAKQEQERKIHEGKLAKEREAREKIQKELEAKQKQERKDKEAKDLRAKKEADENRKLALAPGKEKLKKWVNDMEIKDINSENMNQESILIVGIVMSKFNSFKNWAKSEIDKIK